MRWSTTILALGLAVVAAVAVVQCHRPAAPAAALNPAMARIEATQTLRCGYVPYYPAMVKDEKTAEFKGFDVDLMQAVTQRLGVKLEWSVESSWMNVVTDLTAGKFDMLCNTYWTNPQTAQHTLYSRPIFYQPLFIAAREADTRFDNDLQRINAKDITIAVLDGDAPVEIAAETFPQAKLHALPHNVPFAQVMLEVASGKADVTIVDANNFGGFAAANPGQLKLVQVDKPVRVLPVSFVFGPHDYLLKNAVDNVLDQMILEGSAAKIVKRGATHPSALYPAIIPYVQIP